MIKTTTREIASSSDVNAPVFYFKEYVRGLEYHNNGRQIDFVTDGNSLYVPSTDNVTACKDSIKEDGGFMRLVSEGKQGIQGLKGDPGRDGRTPSVFARFDGRQMIFYTNEINDDGTPKTDDKGNPVTRRIAATNDLTGPSWRPKKVDDTIIWEKTRDDSQPESINLSDLVKETAPVIFRVDSDNTKRSDETSGPANYIQWKYEGDEYWNNLISISELMNLALAGICIWFNEDDQEYHLGHRQVLHATYDSSKTRKRIISKVEHGDVLYDAGPIKLHDFSFEIEALGQEICNLQHRVDAIEEELPKFVKAVIINDKLNRPDEDGIVDLGNLDFYTKEESDERFQPKGDYQPAGNYLTPEDLDFELEKDDNGIKLYVTIKGVRKEVGYTCDCKHGDDPVTVPVTGVTITNCVSSLKVGNTGTITWKVSPDNATDKSVTFTSSNTSVAAVSSTGVVTAKSAGNAVITIKTSDGDYTATCNVTVTDEDEPTPTIPDATVQFNWKPSEANAKFIVNGSSTTNHRFIVGGNETITWKVTAEGYTATSNGEGSWTNDGSTTYKNITIVFEKDSVEPTTYTVTTNKNGGNCSVKPDSLTISKTPNGTYSSSLEFDDDGTSNIVYIKATKNDKDPITGSITVNSATEITLGMGTTTCAWDEEPEPTTYTLTINGNGETVKYRINNGAQETYNSVLTLNADDTVKLDATKSGFTATWNDVSVDRTPLSPSNNEFTMIKDTSINITWTEVTPETYTVNTSISGGNCSSSDKPNTLTISKTQNGTYGSSLTFNEGSGDHIVYVKATKNGKVDKNWTETVNGATTITLDSSDAPGCSWENVTVPCSVSRVTVSPSTLTLTEGQTNTLSKTVNSTGTCENTVTWSSTNTSVATVDKNGKVTAVSAGTATIKATSDDNKTKFGQCAVTVNAAPVTGYMLHVQSHNMPSGAEIAVTYGGSDHTGPNDFTIEAGTNVKISAELEGYTPSYSIVPEGVISSATDFSMPARELTIMIGWSKDNVPVEGISVNASEITVDKGQCVNPSLIITVSPSDATDKSYKWTSDDLTIATISEDGTNLCGINIGTTTITVTTNSKNIDDEYETAKVTVHVVTPDYNIVLPEETIFNVGERKTITATITGTGEPSGPITWNFINMGDSSPFANITNVSPDGLTAEITATQNPGQIGIEAKVESDNKRGGGIITVINPYTIESIKSVYYDTNGNPVTNTYSVNSQSISLPTWSSIQFGVSGSGRDAVSHSEDFIGSVCQGPVETSGSTYYYNYDMYCIDSENQQPIQDGDGTIVFGNLTINMSWNGTYGNPIYQDKENPYSPIQ